MLINAIGDKDIVFVHPKMIRVAMFSCSVREWLRVSMTVGGTWHATLYVDMVHSGAHQLQCITCVGLNSTVKAHHNKIMHATSCSAMSPTKPYDPEGATCSYPKLPQLCHAEHGYESLLDF